MLNERVHIVKEGKHAGGPVVYWMSRDQRVGDNWSLLFAQEVGRKEHAPPGVSGLCFARYAT